MRAERAPSSSATPEDLARSDDFSTVDEYFG
jgi:hypothetical protein